MNELSLPPAFPLASLPGLLAQEGSRSFFEAAPLLPISAGWQALLAIVVVLLLIAYVVRMYWLDGVELPRGIAWTLGAMRIAAILGLVIFFVNPEKRTEKRLVKTSRVPILFDTSSSMGIRDRSATEPNPPSRMEQVSALFADGQVVERLRRDHDVSILKFDASSRPTEIATLGRIETTTDDAGASALAVSRAEQWRGRARLGALVAVGGLLFGGIASLVRMRNRTAQRGEGLAWSTFVGVVAAVGGYALLAYAHLQEPTVSPWGLLTGSLAPPTADDGDRQEGDSATSEADSTVPSEENWLAGVTTPEGEATRLGDALRQVVNQERGGPAAAIVVVTDGRRNAGSEPDAAVAAAREAGIPLIVLGAGSAEPLRNAAVAEISVPRRVFPSDKFQVRGLIRSSNLGGQSVRVRLVSVDEGRTEAEQVEAETTVDLMPDDSPVPVSFDVSRAEEGRRIYELRIEPTADDFDPTDDSRQAIVEVIQRQNRVLLIAGGPTRDYQFLRNQLFRDPEVTLDVWLQSAVEGVAQESDQLLDEFPATRAELFEYDCIVAFDPDWRKLDADACRLLESWVAEQGGGLVIIAGPVFTPEWTRSSRGEEGLELIRRLYPVSFFAQGTGSIRVGRFGGERPFPLEFTREGSAAEFLWLGESAEANEAIWKDFEGVYGYYAVNEAKPGGTIYALFSDPSTEFDGRLPIYMAGQLYGAGRVFFQASGEMWRLREVDVTAFERYYTRLIRWASQGRLLRDSTRGVLLVDRQQCWIGDRIEVQAMLRDAQDRPLAASQVEATVLLPDRSTRQLTLTALADGVRAGTFNGQLAVGDPGDYRISLLVPDSPESEVLTVELRADIPDLERDRAERNDPLLRQLAERTDGTALLPLPRTSADPELTAALERIGRNDLESYLPGTPDEAFTRALMAWLLGGITAALCLEWTTRRLHRLA